MATLARQGDDAHAAKTSIIRSTLPQAHSPAQAFAPPISGSGSFAIMTAIRRASSRESCFIDVRRNGRVARPRAVNPVRQSSSPVITRPSQQSLPRRKASCSVCYSKSAPNFNLDYRLAPVAIISSK